VPKTDQCGGNVALTGVLMRSIVNIYLYYIFMNVIMSKHVAHLAPVSV